MVRKDERPYGVSKLKSPRSAPVAALRSPLVSAPTPSRIPKKKDLYRNSVTLTYITTSKKIRNKLQTHKPLNNSKIKILKLYN